MDARDPLIRIGISSCLLGDKVRYDGGHKLDRFIAETLGSFFEWVRVCPEAEAGLGTPREPMHLEQYGNHVKLVTVTTHAELTSQMNRYASVRIEALAHENLSGYIFKSKSPSCGLLKVPVYAPVTRRASGRRERTGDLVRTGSGLFAEAMQARFPVLPMEEDVRLCEPVICENWIQRVFSYYRLNLLWSSRWTADTLRKFHSRHTLTLVSHSPGASRELGRIVAQADTMPRRELKTRYESEFMSIMEAAATRGKNANVLQRAAGCFKKIIDEDSQRRLSACIADYRRGIVPFELPLTLIRRYLNQYEIPYLSEQVYLNPFPKELALLNEIRFLTEPRP